jgi:hypothetical protein
MGFVETWDPLPPRAPINKKLILCLDVPSFSANTQDGVDDSPSRWLTSFDSFHPLHRSPTPYRTEKCA